MKQKLDCSVCGRTAAPYRCPACDGAPYCSIACFSGHKNDACSAFDRQAPATSGPNLHDEPQQQLKRPIDALQDASVDGRRPLKRLRDLSWPAEPDLSAWDDPLNRDLPKPITPAALQAIATNPALRALLARKADSASRDLPSILADTKTASRVSRASRPLHLALRDTLGLAPLDGVEIPLILPKGAPIPRIRPKEDKRHQTRLIELNEEEKRTMSDFAGLVKRILEAHNKGQDTDSIA